MVLLKRIYSPTDLIDEVKFQKGINIIMGELKRFKDDQTDLSGIGKSTLVRLIDFGLISDSGKKNYFNPNKHSFLEGHSIVLEFEAFGKNYVVKRSINDPTSPKFGSDINSLKKYKESELRSILGGIFYGQDDYSWRYDNSWFRQLIKFFIKDDKKNSNRNNPIKFADKYQKNLNALKLNLFYLDLPNDAVSNYQDLSKEKSKLHKEKNELEERLEEETGKSVEELRNEIRQIDDKINTLEKDLSEYKFNESFEDIEEEIQDISKMISEHRREVNKYKNRLNEFKKSYQVKIEVDKDRIAKIYSEIDEEFGNKVKKNLNDVIEFREHLSENRKEFLKEKEEKLKQNVEEKYDKIEELEKKRSELYNFLDEKEALDSIKENYNRLSKYKREKQKLEDSKERISEIDNKLLNIKQKISRTRVNIHEEIKEFDDEIEEISRLYEKIAMNSIHINSKENINFDIRHTVDGRKSPVEFIVKVPKIEAHGKNRFRILAYDLTVFFHLIKNDRKLPHFLVHDGIFHGIGTEIRVRVLNYINDFYNKNSNFQYIITGKEDELKIPNEEKYGQYNFDLKNKIVAKYTDNPDEMIFGREY